MKQSIKGLKEADDVYSQQIQALNEIKEGLVYKEGSRKGEIRDNFHQIMNTLDGPNRSMMAERLNNLRPGLVEEIQAVHHMKKLADAYYRTPVVWKNLLSKGMGLVLGGAGGSSYGPRGIIAGALAGFFAEQGLTKISQSRVQKLIDGLGKQAQLELETIGNKLEQGKELTTKEDHLLQDLAEELQGTKKDGLGGEEPSPVNPNNGSINKINGNANQSYQKIDGTQIAYKNRTNIRGKDFSKRQFSNKYELALTDNLKPKTQLVDLIKVGELEKGSLAQVPAEAFFDGKARPLELTSDRYAKIFQKHGPFSHENLIATANDWDYMIKDLNGEEGHINLIKELPDGSSLLIGAKRDNGALVVTHFEPTKSLKKVLDDAKGNGGEVITRGLGKLREGAETKYQLAEPIKSENFKQWFGDWENDPKNASKVVDENGEPLVVYHGTEEDFTIFDKNKARLHADIQGMYFAIDPMDSSGYGSKVGAYYLDIKNPADESTAYTIFRKYQGQEYAGVKTREELQEMGYDGVIVIDDEEIAEIIAFEPNQIKSATDNTGSFDPNNPDIRYQKQHKKNYQEYRKEVERYRRELEEGIEVEDDYGQLFSSKKSIQDEISELESELNSYNEDDRMRSNYAEGADTYEERREWIEDNITQYEDLYSKFIAKTKSLEDDIIYSMPAELRELLMNNKDTGGSAWRKAIEAYIDGDSETFDMMMKNIEGAEYRHSHTSYDQIRDEAKGLSEEAYKSYRKEFNTDIETDYRHYIDNHSYQKVSGDKNYGIANPLEKNITAQRATQLENIRNGKSVQELADHYGIALDIVETITTPEGLKAYGKYRDGIITLAEQIKEGTAPHELFHATFDLVDTARKDTILKNIMKEKQLDALNAEEYLADSFAEYFRTGTFDMKTFGAGLIAQIKQFFQQVKEWINGTAKNRRQVKQLFDEILDGEIDREMLGGILGNKKGAVTVRHQQSGPTVATAPIGDSLHITDQNASILKQKMGNLKKGIQTGNRTAKDFLEGVRNNLRFKKSSGYLISEKNGENSMLRISDHYANAWNNKSRGYTTNNTSVVIKFAKGSAFKSDKSVDLIEFVYNPENLTPEKMQGIIKGVQDWMDTGEYTDKGYDHTHTSIRATQHNGEVKYQRVYHGSPYEFDKFDSSYMGEGEGGQAHGWGHYVAVDISTARNYATMKGGVVEYKGKTLEDFFNSSEGSTYSSIEKEIISDIANNISEYFDKPDEARDRAQMEYERAIENGEDISYNRSKLNTLKSLDYDDFVDKGGNVYEVEIPDPVKANTPTGSNYLEEQGKIKSRAVDVIVKQLKKGLSQEKSVELDELVDNWESGYDHSIEGGRMYRIIANTLGSDHKASIFLQSLGYDGIHYHGGRDGEAYVIFDDDKLEIKKHWDNGVEKYKLVEDDLNP